MSPSLVSYIVVAIVAAMVTVMTVPLFRAFAISRGLLVQPDIRKVHLEPTSDLGGGAMFVGFLVGFGVAWLSGWFDVVFSDSTDPLAILLCASMSYLIGVYDDVKQMSAPAKTAGLVLAGSFLPLLGIGIIWFRVPFLELFPVITGIELTAKLLGRFRTGFDFLRPRPGGFRSRLRS